VEKALRIGRPMMSAVAAAFTGSGHERRESDETNQRFGSIRSRHRADGNSISHRIPARNAMTPLVHRSIM
jgi:hypothetical protein